MHVVVAIDLDPDAAALVDAAVDWARHLHATLHLRTVSAQVDDAAAHLRRLSARIPEGMRGTAQALEGRVPKAIAAAGVDVDLLLCATRGRTGLSRLVLGSTCERIVGLSNTPTLVLRRGSGAPPVADRILVPVDPEAPSTSALLVVNRWFPEARVTVVGVLGRQRAPRRALPELACVETHPDRERALKVLTSLLTEVRSGRVRLVLDEAVGTGACIADAAAGHDLIVMTTRRRQAVARLWWGSVAQQVARLAAVPTLVVPCP